MKFVIFFLMLFPVFANAGDMFGFNYGFGQGTKPFYGIDYEFNPDFAYVDVALSGNSDYVQPYLSQGLQFEHLNVGVGIATTLSNYYKGGFSGQFAIGPEIGYMYNLSRDFYVKDNNTYLGYFGQYNFTSTVSFGLNF